MPTNVNSTPSPPLSNPPEKSKNKELLNIGQASYSIGLQIPIIAFLLVFTVTSLVSILFYYETERLLTQQTSAEVAIESDLFEPMIEQLYSQAQADILFLSRTPPIQKLLNALMTDDKVNAQHWKKRLEESFGQFLTNKRYYYQIRYIGVKNDGQELINVRNDRHNIVMPSSRLQKKNQRPYFDATIAKDPGQVYFSKIELAKNYGEIEAPHKPVLRVATPIYDDKNGHIFGLIIINLNFGEYISHLKTKTLKQLSFYLTNRSGDYVSHPNNAKTFGFDLGKRYLIQDEFPPLAPIIQHETNEFSLGKVHVKDKEYLGHFQRVDLKRFDSHHQLNLLVLKDTNEMQNTLSAYRTRSLLLGSLLSIISFLIAIFAARKIATPLKQITHSIENYEKTNKLSKLPINSKTEIGVLARSFNNLFNKMQFALKEQEHSAIIAKQSSDKIKAILSSAAEGFITIDEQGNILAFNQAAEKMFGYNEEEVLNQNIKMLMPVNEGSKHDGYLSKYKETGIAKIMGIGRKLQALKKSGECFPIHLAISKVASEQGTIYTGIIRDISKEESLEREQEKNQQRLMEVNERINLATNAAGIGIWEYDIVNDKLTWDRWMHKLYATSPNEFSGQLAGWKSSVHPEDLEYACQALENAIDTRESLDKDFRIITPDGTIKHLKSMAITKRNSQGDPVKMTGVNIDITEQIIAEEKHIKAKEIAEDTSRHKAEFLACMSHEIRTPMNGILGMLGLLMRNELSSDQMHRVKLAESSAKALLNLINDILDFSKVEAGKLELEVIDFDLRKLLGEFSESLALKCQEKRIEIILDNRGIQLSHVKGDPGRIRQILNNLIGNAIKFTEQGEIVITAELIEGEQEDDDKNSLILHCSVKDTGIGISEDKINNLFQSFTQVDASTTRKYGGTGLGLAISKQLCQLMHGDITVTSTLGEGSTFSFSIRLNKSEQATTVLPYVDIKNTPLLIVDDNITNRLILKSQLELWGAVVYEANSGLAALTLLESNALDNPGSSIKMAFLDMNMPYMDGAELAVNIKENPRLRNVKLAMMTSMASRGDAAYFKSLGFSAYFPKPTITEDIFKALSLCLSEDNDLAQDLPLITHHFLKEVETETDNESKQSSVTCRVLLVEDNRINQEVACHILTEFGITPDVAANGLEAINLLQNNAVEKPYDIVLMDCQMPEMDGYQATQAIRRGEAGANNTEVTIIAMTANAMKGDREKCIESGMTDYLSKPIEPGSLKEKLSQYTEAPLQRDKPINSDESNEGTDIEAVPPEPITTEKTNVKTKNIENTLPLVSENEQAENDDVIEEQAENDDVIEEQAAVWDQVLFSKRLNNNTAIQDKLITLFLEEAPQQLSELALSVSKGDNKQQHAISHKLQGMSGNLSALEFLEYTKEFNTYVKSSSPEQAKTEALLHAMELSFTTLEQELMQTLKS